jgi:hypothetical protein
MISQRKEKGLGQWLMPTIPATKEAEIRSISLRPAQAKS